MPGERRPTPPPIGGFVATSEAAALWRAREEDRYDAEKRFERMESGLHELHEDVTEIKTTVVRMEENEKQRVEVEKTRAESAKERNHRIWQVVSGVIVALAVAVIIALWKVFAPIAIGGSQSKPPTVNQTVDQLQGTLGGTH